MLAVLFGLGIFSVITSYSSQAYALAGDASLRYISSTGVDSNNDCTNLATPCGTWQYTLDTAQAGDTILATGGVYTAISVTQIAVISQSITIRGGYTAVFTSPPDPVANPTILDAQGQGRVIAIRDAEQVIISGLYLTGGNTFAASDRGGGLYAINSGLILTTSVIHQNEAGYGGGIYLQNSEVSLFDNEISDNQARFSGGGIRCYDCVGFINHNQIVSNTAVLHGGGFHLTNSPLTLTGNSIQNNQTPIISTSWGGGGHLHNSPAILSGNIISGNSGYQGGGLRLINSSATLQGNLIQNNQASIGGALTMEGSSHAFLENNALVGNSALSLGGGIYILGAEPTLYHTTFNDNETAVYATGSAQVNMANSLIANHLSGVINSGAAITLTTTLWDNVTTTVQGGVAETGAINGTSGFAVDGYHITAVSDAINAAVFTNTYRDIDDQIRPLYDGTDIGADEWWVLNAAKTASHYFVKPGQIITYTITITNENSATANMLLTDTLPVQLDYIGPVSATTGSANYNSGTVYWQGSLDNQESVTIFWPMQIHNNLQNGTVITNSATIQDEHGLYETETAVMVVPSELYLPLVTR